LAIYSNEIVSLVGKWIELEIFLLSERSQSQKQVLHVFSYLDSKEGKGHKSKEGTTRIGKKGRGEEKVIEG
jgi:hypothetical protein